MVFQMYVFCINFCFIICFGSLKWEMCMRIISSNNNNLELYKKKNFPWLTSCQPTLAPHTFGHNSLFRSLHNAADTLGMYLTSHLLLGVTLTLLGLFWTSCCVLLLMAVAMGHCTRLPLVLKKQIVNYLSSLGWATPFLNFLSSFYLVLQGVGWCLGW